MLYPYALTIRARGANIVSAVLIEAAVGSCIGGLPALYHKQRGNFTPKYGIGVESCQRNLFGTRGFYAKFNGIKCCHYVYNDSLGIKFSIYAPKAQWHKIFPSHTVANIGPADPATAGPMFAA